MVIFRFTRPVRAIEDGTRDRHAMWEVVKANDIIVILKDIGPWDKYMTITNDAEWVVETCLMRGLGNRQLAYYDSEGELTFLAHDDKKFLGFYPPPKDLPVKSNPRFDDLIMED